MQPSGPRDDIHLLGAELEAATESNRQQRDALEVRFELRFALVQRSHQHPDRLALGRARAGPLLGVHPAVCKPQGVCRGAGLLGKQHDAPRAADRERLAVFPEGERCGFGNRLG